MSNNKKLLSYFDVLSAKKTYMEGGNIIELLRAQKNIEFNAPEIIEVAYDLQAGTYIENSIKNAKQENLYANELASIIDSHINANDSLLDIGAGELTTLSSVVSKLTQKPVAIYAFDISWSRIFKGIAFAKVNMKDQYKSLKVFVGDISEIPFFDKSINVTISSHALEPNGEKLKELINELFRVTNDKLILFEPCYEICSELAKQRMERLGYIKNVDGVVRELGGKIIDKIIIKNISNPLNPTVCFIIRPPFQSNNAFKKSDRKGGIFSVPGTNYPLKLLENFYLSNETGLCYPILKNIPIFKSTTAILATALVE